MYIQTFPFPCNIFTFSNLDCQLGTFRAFTKTSANLQCVPCPVGTYSDTINARAQCTYCPQPKTHNPQPKLGITVDHSAL